MLRKYISRVFTDREVTNEFGRPPKMASCQFIDVDFDHVDLREAHVQGALFHDVQFICCNMTGVDLSCARLTGNTKCVPC